MTKRDLAGLAGEEATSVDGRKLEQKLAVLEKAIMENMFSADYVSVASATVT